VILPDVNVLISAFRPDAAQHVICAAWLTRVVATDAPFGISTLTTSALIRITTNARVHIAPSRIEEAFAFCDKIMSQPNCHLIEPGSRHWAIFRNLCVDTKTIGPDITDAWFAALAIEHNCEWITYDRDFARFPGLRWSNPS
jgi:toxin-antitoxin system PIN domain toxin